MRVIQRNILEPVRTRGKENIKWMRVKCMIEEDKRRVDKDFDGNLVRCRKRIKAILEGSIKV